MWLDIFCDPVMRQRQVCFFPFFFFGSFKKLKYTLFVLFTRLKFCATFLSLRACVCVWEWVCHYIHFWSGTVISFLICPSIEWNLYYIFPNINHVAQTRQIINGRSFRWTKQNKAKWNETKHYEGEILWITQFVLKLYALCCRDILSCMIT